MAVEDEVVTHEEEVLGGAIAAMGGGDGATASAAPRRKEEDERAKNARMVDEATDSVRARVTDIEAFLSSALSDAEITSRAADYLRRLVKSVGAVDFGPRGGVASASTQVSELDLAPGDDGAAVGAAPLLGAPTPSAAPESAVDRILRMGRQGKLRTDDDKGGGGGGGGRRPSVTLLPPRIASRTILQLLVDKAARGGQNERLCDFVYSFFLHMYGVRKLAEANLVGLILTCVASVTGGEAGGGAKEHPRLATFARVCAMRDEPTVHDAADADLVCNMYAELSAAMQAYNASLPGSPAVLAEARLPTGEDGNALLCPAAACKSTVRALFQHVHSLHLETFDEIVQLVDEVATERKGKAVVDVDLLVSRVLAKWHEGATRCGSRWARSSRRPTSTATASSRGGVRDRRAARAALGDRGPRLVRLPRVRRAHAERHGVGAAAADPFPRRRARHARRARAGGTADGTREHAGVHGAAQRRRRGRRHQRGRLCRHDREPRPPGRPPQLGERP